MTSNIILRSSFRLAAAAAVAGTALVGCSTVKSISPFGSNVPYAQDVQPTIPRPAVTEVPAFKAKAQPPAPPSKPAPPVVASPQPAAPATPPSLPQAGSPVAEPTPAPKSSSIDAPAPQVAGAQASTTVADVVAGEKNPTGASAKSGTRDKTTDAGKEEGPSIPDERRAFKDDGTYPNLAQVPPRPVNMPTFAEAATLEKSLVADREKAKDVSPASPEAPSVDSAPVTISIPINSKAPVTPASVSKAAAVASRTEDGSPCLTEKPVDAEPAAIIHFDPGSSAMSAGNLAILADAMPTIRAAKGTIRIFGHGDIETNASAGLTRFDLAAARAGSVAQAVAGYGIPVPRIAVGVACNDAAVAGASVQPSLKS